MFTRVQHDDGRVVVRFVIESPGPGEDPSGASGVFTMPRVGQVAVAPPSASGAGGLAPS
jgi:hypothetical protein